MGMLRADGLTIRINRANLVFAVEFFNQEGDRVSVSFEKLGEYPQHRIELKVQCGGFVTNTVDGDNIFGQCFLLGEKWNHFILQTADKNEVEEEIVGIDLVRESLILHIVGDDGSKTEIWINITQISKETNDMEKRYDMALQVPIILLVIS